MRDDKAVGRPVFENEVRIVKDKNNKVKYYEYTSHSQVNGVYDIVRKTPEGKQKVLSSGKIDKKTGIVVGKLVEQDGKFEFVALGDGVVVSDLRDLATKSKQY